MSDQSFTDWLGGVAEQFGFTSSASAETSSSETGTEVCEDVRPPEMVSGASGTQYSTGENTYQGMEEGGDFAEEARENAEENDHSDVYSMYEDGANPMQSPNLGKSSDFALRYGVGFLCADYQGGGDLPDIAELSKPKSAYLAAFKGMDKTKQYKDPTSGQIVAGIQKWVKLLAKDLKGCGQGELVVSFQGHGENGNIYGVDYKQISSSKLLSIAKAATKSRVSITYMLDACFSGNAVPGFQDNAADHVDDRIDRDAEGAGNVSSEANHAHAEALRDQMAHARYLIQVSAEVGTLGDKLSTCTDAIEQNNDEASWNAAIALNKQIIAKIKALQTQFLHNMDFGSTSEMRLGDIESAFTKTLGYLNGIEPFTCFDYNEWTGAVGNFQDTVSNGANRIIKLVKKELDALK